MNNKIRVVIADDHDIYLEGLENRLNASDDVEVVASASNGKKLVELARQYAPDVVVTDMRMPQMNGLEAITEIHKTHSNIPVLVLSNFDDTYLVLDAMDAGARGYVLKDAPKEEIIRAVKTVSDNIDYYCSRTNANLARLLKSRRFHSDPFLNNELFSPFEKKIIHYICEEKTSKEIAALLHIGRRSIESYRSAILSKMKVKTSIGIALYAYRHKLYPVPDALPRNR